MSSLPNKNALKAVTDDVNEKILSDDEILLATKDMCKYCFDIILSTLTRKSNMSTKSLDAFIESLSTLARCPLFVTWDKHREGDYHLRGCIGTLAPLELRVALGEYAMTSAFRDPRFRPINLNEVPNLRVSVSLLVNYEDCEHSLDWEVGVHGIIINFSVGSKDYNATYLPEVAAEQQWTQQQAIASLAHKAGFRNQLTPEVQSQIQCTRYQSSKHYLKFEEYVRMADSIPCQG